MHAPAGKSQQSGVLPALPNYISRRITWEDRLYWSGWGGRIRTSDWLIQSSPRKTCHAGPTRTTKTDKNSTDNYGAVGQAAHE